MVLYVDDDAPLGGDGLTWGTAYRYLQNALDFAYPWQNDVTEVRIAQGTYKPDRSATHPEGSGDKAAHSDASFDGMMLGGFAGVGAIDPDERNIDAFPTIFSGDLNGDDQPGFVNFEDNSESVMVVAGGALPLDGCTFAGGMIGIRSFSYIPIVELPTGVQPDGDAWVGRLALLHRLALLAETPLRSSLNWTPLNSIIAISRRIRRRFQGIRGDFSDHKLSIHRQHRRCFPRLGEFCKILELRIRQQYGGTRRRGSHWRIRQLGSVGLFAKTARSKRIPLCGAERFTAKAHGQFAYFQCINCLFFNNSATNMGVRHLQPLQRRQAVRTAPRPHIQRQSPGPSSTPIFQRSEFSTPSSKATPAAASAATAREPVRDSNIDGGHAGIGNIDVDPKFRNIALGNLKLKAGSKCIDAGRKSYLPSDILTDLAGKPRLVDAPGTPNTGAGSRPIDIGAYEFQRN